MYKKRTQLIHDLGDGWWWLVVIGLRNALKEKENRKRFDASRDAATRRQPSKEKVLRSVQFLPFFYKNPFLSLAAKYNPIMCETTRFFTKHNNCLI